MLPACTSFVNSVVSRSSARHARSLPQFICLRVPSHYTLLSIAMFSADNQTAHVDSPFIKHRIPDINRQMRNLFLDFFTSYAFEAAIDASTNYISKFPWWLLSVSDEPLCEIRTVLSGRFEKRPWQSACTSILSAVEEVVLFCLETADRPNATTRSRVLLPISSWRTRWWHVLPISIPFPTSNCWSPMPSLVNMQG